MLSIISRIILGKHKDHPKDTLGGLMLSISAKCAETEFMMLLYIILGSWANCSNHIFMGYLASFITFLCVVTIIYKSCKYYF